MNLVIDVGNSAIKLAVFKNKQMLVKSIINHDALETSFAELHNQFKILKTIVCSVTNLDAREELFLKSHNHVLKLNSQTRVQFDLHLKFQVLHKD